MINSCVTLVHVNSISAQLQDKDEKRNMSHNFLRGNKISTPRSSFWCNPMWVPLRETVSKTQQTTAWRLLREALDQRVPGIAQEPILSDVEPHFYLGHSQPFKMRWYEITTISYPPSFFERKRNYLAVHRRTKLRHMAFPTQASEPEAITVPRVHRPNQTIGSR